MSKLHKALITRRIDTPHPDRIIALSGAFNIIHPGHTRMIQGALNFGRVMIILNSDAWIMRNKGILSMTWMDRREVLLSLHGVSEVVPVDDSDNTVCEALERTRPHIFGNGGPRTKVNTPEGDLCRRLGITCVWGIGGGERDVYSNSILRNIARSVSSGQ